MLQRLRVHIIFQLLLTCSMLAGPAVVHAADTRELSLTTAFLFNFAKYTEWPTEEDGTFSFCVEEKAEISPFMAKLASRKIREQKIEVQKVSSTAEIAICDVIYFESKSLLYDMILRENRAILIVGRDLPAVDINLFKAEDTLQFSIQLERAEALGFKFRSQLLKIAAETK